MAAKDSLDERAALTAAAVAATGLPDAQEATVAHQRRWGRLPTRVGAIAAVLVFLGLALFAAVRRSASGDVAGNDEAAKALENGDGESLHALVGPFGEYAGPAPPFGTGKYFWGQSVANMGSPPRPHEPHSIEPTPGCPGTSCNGGKLCCGSDAICCGTSCCSGGSICCNGHLGLCCAQGTMCCYGKMCCSPSFKCGDSRTVTDGLRYQVLQQCGGGAQIRRLMDQVYYKHQFRKLLATNETGLKELLGIQGGQAQQEK
jgi:hypothetical protein